MKRNKDETNVLAQRPFPFSLLDKWVRVRELQSKYTEAINTAVMVADVHRKTRHVHTEDEKDAYIVGPVSGSPEFFFVAHEHRRVGVYHVDELDLLYPLPVERLMRGMEILYEFGQDDDSRECSIDQDIIYVGGKSPHRLAPAMREELTWLGWTYDDHYECWSLYL